MSRQNAQVINDEIQALQKQVLRILDRLETVWNSPDWEPNRKPVDELIATILSQNTSDTNTERAFLALRTAYPSWSQVKEAPVEKLAETIRSGGLARRKAPRIQQVLRLILDETSDDVNQAFLDRLKGTDPEKAMNELTELPGVGPKTASCVLLFAVGLPVIPVDTHVHRVSRRIGLIGPRVDANRAHYELARIVDPGDAYRFHVQLIRHGREICRSRNPRCRQCVLLELCEFGTVRIQDG